MEEAKGWLFDVYIQGARAVVWVKTEDGRTIRLTDRYSPFFHLEPAKEVQEDELLYRLSESPEVRAARIEEKLTSLESGRRRSLVRVEPHDPRSFRALLRIVERNPCVSRIYNASLRHVQLYLFTRLCIEPSSRVKISFESGRLVGMEKLDDWHELAPPPLSIMHFSLHYDLSEGRRIISGISARFRREARAFGGKPHEVLASFRDYVKDRDPDLLLCPKCDKLAYPLLRSGFQEEGLSFDLGRCDDADQVRFQGSFAGRVMLGDIFYGFSTDEWGIAGLVERTRFSFGPIGLSTRWLSNKSIDSRNCFELMRRGYAIPKEEYFEEVRALGELASRDRGGITITPEAGRLHENVAALDFDSQYPNIILKNNLSYESPEDHNSSSEADTPASGAGILPTVIGPWLHRRLDLKKLKRTLPEGSPSRLYCEERIDALKMILVTEYGISGCCRNRFGNVVTFEEINKKSRECILRAKSISESKGFRIIYGDVDSLFVSRVGAGREEYEALAADIALETGLPMSLDKHFRFVAFLPLKGDPASSALKRYFGLTSDGKVEARGIELRRSDTPEFIRAFQERMIRLVLDSRDLGEACTSGVERGKALLRETLGRLMAGEVDPQDLIVRRRLGKDMNEYKASVCQRSAAIQLLHSGREIEVGDDIPFIYTDHCNANPACRVRAPELFSGSYDREMYAELLREAAMTVWRGIGANPGLKPSVPTLDDWLGTNKFSAR